MVEIKTHCCGAVICTGTSVKNVVIAAACDEVSLAHADLSHQNLQWLDLRGMDLSGVNLEGSDLSGTVFRSVDLTGANLKRTILDGCDFRGAILDDVCFNQASVSGAKIDYNKWAQLQAGNFMYLRGNWDFMGRDREAYHV